MFAEEKLVLAALLFTIKSVVFFPENDIGSVVEEFTHCMIEDVLSVTPALNEVDKHAADVQQVEYLVNSVARFMQKRGSPDAVVQSLFFKLTKLQLLLLSDLIESKQAISVLPSFVDCSDELDKLFNAVLVIKTFRAFASRANVINALNIKNISEVVHHVHAMLDDIVYVIQLTDEHKESTSSCTKGIYTTLETGYKAEEIKSDLQNHVHSLHFEAALRFMDASLEIICHRVPEIRYILPALAGLHLSALSAVN